MENNIMQKYTKEILEEVVNNSKSCSDVLRHFGVRPVGGNYVNLQRNIKKFNIDISHFPKQNKNVSHSEVLINNTSITKYRQTPSLLRRSLVKAGRKYKCEDCGCEEIWNNKPITLHVDHINGDCYDNRIENLRFLCPNCHSQTDTYCRGKGKNSNILKDKCPNCNNNKRRSSTLCHSCNIKTSEGCNRVKNKPNKEELVELLKTHSHYDIASKFNCHKDTVGKWKIQYNIKNTKRIRTSKRVSKVLLIEDLKILPMTQIGKKYGVSDKTIRNWCNYYNIPYTKKDIEIWRASYKKDNI